jgi:hypothetical protein
MVLTIEEKKANAAAMEKWAAEVMAAKMLSRCGFNGSIHDYLRKANMEDIYTLPPQFGGRRKPIRPDLGYYDTHAC